jgi:type I restriction enzyme M protein
LDKERLEGDVGKGHLFPFGLPRSDNANYLWIQLFYSTLSEKGRAGFVMANSASDARSSEQELRRQLIEDQAVDVVVAVGPNMFYTVTLPVTLWVLDRAKKLHVPTSCSSCSTPLPADRPSTSRLTPADRLPRQPRSPLSQRRPHRSVAKAEAKIRRSLARSRKRHSGLCRTAGLRTSRRGVVAQPGRYVGVAPGEAVSDEDFKLNSKC